MITVPNTNDVFRDRRNSKYIVVSTRFPKDSNRNLIVLTDIRYWADNYVQLEQWCHDNSAVVKGMTIECSDAALMMFILRWS